jgi:hypothetical protein
MHPDGCLVVEKSHDRRRQFMLSVPLLLNITITDAINLRPMVWRADVKDGEKENTSG